MTTFGINSNSKLFWIFYALRFLNRGLSFWWWDLLTTTWALQLIKYIKLPIIWLKTLLFLAGHDYLFYFCFHIEFFFLFGGYYIFVFLLLTLLTNLRILNRLFAQYQWRVQKFTFNFFHLLFLRFLLYSSTELLFDLLLLFLECKSTMF